MRASTTLGKCQAPDCDRPDVAKGVCLMHYKRFLRNGHYGLSTRDRGQRKKHPLYALWKRTHRVSNKDLGRWNDFWVFVEELGPRPSSNFRLVRKDMIGLFSPENLAWQEKLPFDFTNKKESAAYQRNRRKTVLGWSKEQDLKNKYGLSAEDYGHMFAEQNGVCAICHNPEWVTHTKTGKIFSLGVDHNHATGAVRGLLCVNCNKVIGHAHDRRDVLIDAIKYLDKYTSKNSVVAFKKGSL